MPVAQIAGHIFRKDPLGTLVGGYDHMVEAFVIRKDVRVTEIVGRIGILRSGKEE